MNNETKHEIMREEDENLRLLTEYLNHQLDPERVAIVRQRLEEDQAFREWAAPLLLAWSVPAHHESHPVPQGEIEKRWDEFTKRAGFVHQRRKARRRRLIITALVVVALGIAGLAFRGRVTAWYQDYRNFRTLPFSADWTSIGTGMQVRQHAGAALRVRRTPQQGMVVARLRGSADFRLTPQYKAGEVLPQVTPLTVMTKGCAVSSSAGEFSVATRGDTTEVAVRVPATRVQLGFLALPTTVTLMRPGESDTRTVREQERGQCVAGRDLTPEEQP